MSKCGRDVLKNGDMILCYLLFFFSLILLKPSLNSCGLSQEMSSACGIRLVESQARAYYVTQFTYNSEKPTDLNYSISRVSYVHPSRTTVESLHYFVLPSDRSHSSLYCTQELKPPDISYDQILQRSTLNFEIRRRVPRVRKQTN